MYNKCTYKAKEPVFTVPREYDDSLTDRRHFYKKKLTKKEKESTTQVPPVHRVSVYPRHYHDDENENFFPHGFPVHDNCWKIAVKIIGADRLDRELNVFVEALKDRFNSENMLNDGRHIADWIVNERGNRDTWYQANRTVEDVNHNLIAMHDPIHVDEVEELIAESARRYSSTKGMLQSDGAATSPDQTGAYDSAMSLLDELHHSEVEAFLENTKTVVPWWYWVRRAPKDIIWELESIDSYRTPMDWQYLCLRAERLCEESFGIINRDRICYNLREIKDSMIRCTSNDDDVSVLERASSEGVSTLTANTKSAEREVDLTDSDWEKDAFMEDD